MKDAGQREAAPGCLRSRRRQARRSRSRASDPELPLTLVAIASKQPQLVPHTDTDARKAIVDQLYSTMLNQRLDEIAQKDTSPYVGARVGRQPLMRPIDDQWFQGGGRQGQQASAETLEVLATESARVCSSSGSSTPELARAKQDLLHQVEVRAKEKDKTESGERVEELVRMFLNGEPFLPTPRTTTSRSRRQADAGHHLAAELQGGRARSPAGETNRVV